MSKFYTKFALGILGYIALAQPLIMCALNEQEEQQVGDQTYCPNVNCWSYVKDCKEHIPVQTKIAQVAVVTQIPTMRRCLSDLHKRMPSNMKCLASACRVADGRPCNTPLDTDYYGSAY